MIKTGQTIYEIFQSLDVNNNPSVPANFVGKIYTNGTINNVDTVDFFLSDINEGIYTMFWSASTFGFYQIYIKNINNNNTYISEIYNVKPDSEVDNITNVYVGL
jgi:hypothetical protein